MSSPLLTPATPETLARWPEPEKRAQLPDFPERSPFYAGLVVSALLHAAAIAAIALFETGPKSATASQPPKVDLVNKMPSPQKQQKPTPNATTEPGLRKPPPAPPPALRKPPPEPPPQPQVKPRSAGGKPHAATASTPNESQNALPFFSMPNRFLAQTLSGQGQAGDSYKGLVFGMLARAERVSQAPRESGQVVVSFSVDGQGRLVSLVLAQSSGHADLDAQALAMVRGVAPFPPPPPGALRSFAAAIEFGER